MTAIRPSRALPRRRTFAAQAPAHGGPAAAGAGLDRPALGVLY